MLFAFETLAPEIIGAEAFGAEALGTALGAEALMGLGAEALGTSAIGGAEAALGADAMAANAAAGGAGAGGAGVNAAQVAAQQNAAMQLANPGITSIPEVMSPAQQAYQAASSANSMQGITPGTAPLPAYPNDFQSVNQIANQVASTATPPPISLTPPPPPPSGLEAGFDKALRFAEKNPFTAMTGAYMGASALGLLNPSGATFNNTPYDGPLSKYKLAPNFQASVANPANFQYNPATNRRYAAGGIMDAGAYDIPVGYDEGGPVALPLPSRTVRSSDAFRVPGAAYDPAQVASADAYNDILRNRVIADTQTGRANDPMYGVADARQLETRANSPERGFTPLVAQRELLNRSNEGEFAAPGYGDLGQFAGSFDPANVPMGDNRYSPADQYRMIARDASIVNSITDGSATVMPRDGGRTSMANLASDSGAGRFAVPGYGDLGQFAGTFDPANVPMGSNKFSPVDQYKNIVQDTKLATGEIGVNDYSAALLPPNTSDIEGQKIAQGFLQGDSDAGRFAVPGYGDLGQFAGSNDIGGGMGGGSLGKYYDDMSASAYAKGGSLSDSITEYQKMLEGRPQAAPARSADVGIYYDQDPDTRYQDALTAAQIRQAKVNQRAYVSPPVAKRPTPLGKLNMPTSAKSKESNSGDVEAASGGIMQSSLGGYAAGGNPRLLKGPGDGMSDNIPATINGRQPARLADGEFVIPADVVSHLGNGSTEAGAKQLHAMMNKVRSARTGNSKQGKQINAKKYMPR
jgi:hypothetical protein